MFCIFCQFNIKLDSVCVCVCIFDHSLSIEWYRWAFLLRVSFSRFVVRLFMIFKKKTIFIFVVSFVGFSFPFLIYNSQKKKRLIMFCLFRLCWIMKCFLCICRSIGFNKYFARNTLCWREKKKKKRANNQVMKKAHEETERNKKRRRKNRNKLLEYILNMSIAIQNLVDSNLYN